MRHIKHAREKINKDQTKENSHYGSRSDDLEDFRPIRAYYDIVLTNGRMTLGVTLTYR